MSEAWLDVYDDGYIHQFQPEPLHKNSPAAAEALNLEISSHRASLKWSRRPSQSARE